MPAVAVPDFAAQSAPPAFAPAPEISEAVRSVGKGPGLVPLAVPAETAHFSNLC